MITSIELTGQKVTLSDSLKRYVDKKIGQLDRYLPKRARGSVRAEVRLKQVNRDHGNKYEAEVMLHTPDHSIVAKDTTLNVFAALDIVREKLVRQMKRYKDERITHSGHRHPSTQSPKQ